MQAPASRGKLTGADTLVEDTLTAEQSPDGRD
ncbi:MAG: hypothetical protein JWR08_340, partial [Enterovirga sp.]|nr:hypothetical protein [Enterovirga sp.]